MKRKKVPKDTKNRICKYPESFSLMTPERKCQGWWKNVLISVKLPATGQDGGWQKKYKLVWAKRRCWQQQTVPGD